MCEARHRNDSALAHVTDPDTDPDRRAWHQATRRLGPTKALTLSWIRCSGPSGAPVRDGVVALVGQGASLHCDEKSHRRNGHAGQHCALSDANAVGARYLQDVISLAGRLGFFLSR